MTKLTVKGDKELLAKIRQVGERMQKGMHTATLAGGEVARTEALRLAPGPHIEVEIDNERLGRVELNVGPDGAHWYYIFFETGAGRHEIDGKVMKAVAFIDGADEIVVKRVTHPGIAAQPFLRPAMEDHQEAIKDAMINVFNRELDAIIRGG